MLIDLIVLLDVGVIVAFLVVFIIFGLFLVLKLRLLVRHLEVLGVWLHAAVEGRHRTEGLETIGSRESWHLRSLL